MKRVAHAWMVAGAVLLLIASAQGESGDWRLAAVGVLAEAGVPNGHWAANAASVVAASARGAFLDGAFRGGEPPTDSQTVLVFISGVRGFVAMVARDRPGLWDSPDRRECRVPPVNRAQPIPPDRWVSPLLVAPWALPAPTVSRAGTSAATDSTIPRRR